MKLISKYSSSYLSLVKYKPRLAAGVFVYFKFYFPQITQILFHADYSDNADNADNSDFADFNNEKGK